MAIKPSTVKTIDSLRLPDITGDSQGAEVEFFEQLGRSSDAMRVWAIKLEIRHRRTGIRCFARVLVLGEDCRLALQNYTDVHECSG